MNELQIKHILESDARARDAFRGVYARNKLPIRAPTTSLYVCNTDPNHKPGEHWVTIYINNDRRGEYFDSFGMPPLFDEFVTFLNNNTKSWTHNKELSKTFIRVHVDYTAYFTPCIDVLDSMWVQLQTCIRTMLYLTMRSQRNLLEKCSLML